ncbi:MAG: alpha/beta hydrolase [Acidobacteriaceae bacterium]
MEFITDWKTGILLHSRDMGSRRLFCSLSVSLLFATLFLPGVASAPAQSTSSATPQHLFFRVTLAPQYKGPVSGRLLVFAKPGNRPTDVDVDPFHPQIVSIAAKDVAFWQPGQSVDIDTDDLAYPQGFSHLKRGEYVVQAVLDVNLLYPYEGRTPGDLVSAPSLWDPNNGTGPQIELKRTLPPLPNKWLPATMTTEQKQAVVAATGPLDFTSPLLTHFWGRTMRLRGWVVLPPGYKAHRKERWPTVYWTHGFGGTQHNVHPFAAMLYQRMAEGKMPPMIWVLLDESSPRGTQEFADSVNNGPWGKALTTELVPYLEHIYRMDARPSGRFLQGHSSGGWASLWLQVAYPKFFGGTWSTSPDPSDFHDFLGVDLYAPHANLYHQPDGTPYPLIRDHGKVLATLEQFAREEQVLGPYGGQMASFEWVFSPRGPGGRPEQMFNRATGDVDPEVVAYWQEHYDIAHRVAAEWPQIGPELRGKIHLYVGTADTFYLDGAAHRLDAVLQGLDADAHFTYLPDRTHFDLYRVGDDHFGLFDQMAAEMYAVARPKAHWTPAGQALPTVPPTPAVQPSPAH